MTVCVFSGQGAQYEGMGKDLAVGNRAAADVYEACSTYLGYDILQLTGEQLKETRYSQPATVVLSLAAFSAWQATGATAFDDQIVLAGFSLGEYAALGAARVLDLESLMNLLQKRSEYMQAACEQTDGAMYAILGLQDEQVEAVCAQSEFKNKVFPANYNCPGQLVISGHAEPTASAAEACKEAGAKRAVQLQVAGAFHTPLMNAAAEQLAAYASALPFQTAALPVYSNFTAAPVPADVDPAAYLATHMISPVRWTSEVQQIIADGHTSFIEFGPGKVLSGLIRKIDRSVKVGRVEDMATLAAAATD